MKRTNLSNDFFSRTALLLWPFLAIPLYGCLRGYGEPEDVKSHVIERVVNSMGNDDKRLLMISRDVCHVCFELTLEILRNHPQREKSGNHNCGK